MNAQVSAQHLRGLLPDALLEKHSFWRTGPHTLYGYPDPATDDNSVIVVSMHRAKNGTDWQAVVRRLEARYAVRADADGNEHVSAANQPMTLLNLMEALRPASHECNGDVRLLRRLAQLWSALDDLSHVLVWSASFGEVGSLCHVCNTLSGGWLVCVLTMSITYAYRHCTINAK